MRSYLPPLAPPPGGIPHEDPAAVATIKRWFAEELKLGEDAAIFVSESRCQDPACPLVETTVAVFEEGKPGRRWAFARPKVAVSRVNIKLALSMNPQGTSGA